VACNAGTYSIQDPFIAQSCKQCLTNAVCIGAQYFYPGAGYWRMNKNSENIIQCDNEDACM